MAMAKTKGLDLMMALGPPDEGGGSEGKKGSSYLDAKDPQLVAHLMDAVDDAMPMEKRAEALCRAMEAFSGDEEQSEEEPSDEGDMADAGAYE